MIDLTKIEKPFGLLDKETQERLKAHGGPYEYYALGGSWRDTRPAWLKGCTYRVKPQPETEIIQTTVSPPKAPEKPEVKVGSWWKSIHYHTPFEVLCIHGDNAYIADTGVYRGRCVELSYITRHCTPYNPPRKCEGWVNVYVYGDGFRFGARTYNDEQEAREEGGEVVTYITTIHIEYTEVQYDA